MGRQKLTTRLIFLTIAVLVSYGESLAQYSESSWEERDSWMKVDELFELANIKAGYNVADIGCHEGYLTMHLANAVDTAGKVYAVDVRKDRLENLKKNLKTRNIKHVSPVLGDYDDPKLPNNSLDVVMIVDTYHEIEDYNTVLKHIKKALKPGGRLVVLEKFKTHTKGKSRQEQVDDHTIALKFVRKELEEQGFEIKEAANYFGNWKNDAKKPMWVLVGEDDD